MAGRKWASTPAVEAAKQRAEGRDRGAPVMHAPRFDQVADNAPKTPAAGELPPQQRQARDPAEVKKDLEEAAKALQAQEAESGRAAPAQELEKQEKETKRPTLGDLKGPRYWDQYRSSLEKFDPDLKEPDPNAIDEEGDLWESEGDFRQNPIRKAIEGRLQPLSINDIILYESVEQHHVLIPGALEVVFRSLTTNEDLAIKDMVYELIGSDRYVLDCLTVMTLTCGLKSFNGAELPSHLIEKEGEYVVDKEKFRLKYERVKSLALHTVALLSVAYMWFDRRIRAQVVDEILGKSSRPRSDGPAPT